MSMITFLHSHSHHLLYVVLHSCHYSNCLLLHQLHLEMISEEDMDEDTLEDMEVGDQCSKVEAQCREVEVEDMVRVDTHLH